MIPRWRLAYSYAKTSGNLSKSFLGPRLRLLTECQNAPELYALVFPGPVPQVPVPRLIEEAGRSLNDRQRDAFRLVEKIFGENSGFLAQTMRRAEFGNAQTIVRALQAKASSLPALRPAGRYAEIRREAYPDPAGLFGKTRFGWLAEEALAGEIWDLENRLDRQYFSELMETARELPNKDRSRLRRIVAMEARLLNAVWALRLSVYFKMTPGEIARRLIAFEGIDVTGEALAAAGFDPEDRKAWSSWAFSFLVNEGSRRPAWRIDPSEVERAASQRFYVALRRLYHQGPFSLVPAYAFLRLKQREGDFIRSAFEGMRMSLTPRELETMLGVTR